MLSLPSIEIILLVASILLFLSVVASKMSDRLGVPALVLFLLIGMLAGTEGIGNIHFNDPWLAKSLGIAALIFILFSGGVETRLEDVRSVKFSGILLSTVGVLLTALIVGLFVFYVLDFALGQALLLGVIVSSTDVAAVFTVLRSKKLNLRGKIRPLVELESGCNDPVAVILTVTLIQFLMDDSFQVGNFFPSLLWQIVFGAVMGMAMGHFMRFVINRVQLSYEGLYSTLTIALVVLTYGLTSVLHGNGFLAVYLAALILGNKNFVHKKPIIQFHQGLTWLMQIIMFLALGLLVFPSRLVSIAGIGIMVSLVLMFVARPVAVFVCLLFSKFHWREKGMISWLGLKGSVPIILATFPLIANVPDAGTIFDIVFFVVLISVSLQGTTIPFAAKRLKVEAPFESKRVHPIAMEYTEGIDANLEEILVPYDSKVFGKKIFELTLPEECLIVLICRDEKFFIPKGTTELEEGDVLLVLGKNKDIKEFQKVFL